MKASMNIQGERRIDTETTTKKPEDKTTSPNTHESTNPEKVLTYLTTHQPDLETSVAANYKSAWHFIKTSEVLQFYRNVDL